MLDLCKLIFGTVIDLLRSRATLEAEVVVLRQQINVLRRASPKRRPFGAIDRLILGGVCRLFPKSYDALAIVRPDTVIRWPRPGFRLYWRWKSRRRCGRPIVSFEIRRLIREMSVANPLWGAPRIHGELLKLGIDVGQTTVPTANPKQLTEARESVDSSMDERSLRVDLVRLDRSVPVARCVGSRNPCASASAQCPAAEIAEASGPQQHRPLVACWALSSGSRGAGCPEDCKARDVDELAPRRLPSLLALEIPTARWPAEDSGRHSPPHSRDERR